MKKTLFLFLAVAGLTLPAVAQWQTQPQIDPRVGPIYPVNPSFNYQSASNSDPYQFNWGTGRWDYTPIPYNSPTSGQVQQPPPQRPYANNGGPWIYGSPNTPAPAPSSANQSAVNSQANAPAPKPDDTDLWTGPTTRPGATVSPKVVKFEGKLVAVKAVNFTGDSMPHLLLRLRNDGGATGTIDVGQRLALPDGAITDPKNEIVATGQLGILDGHLLLFANAISIGSTTMAVDHRRGGVEQNQK